MLSCWRERLKPVEVKQSVQRLFPTGSLMSPRRANPELAGRRREALEKAGYNRQRAARMLGISSTTLWRKMKAIASRDEAAGEV